MSGFSCITPFIKLLFVFLLLCYTICLPVYTSGDPHPKEINNELFKPGQIDTVQKSSGKKSEKIENGMNFNEIKLPFFVSAKNDVIVAAAEASYTNNEQKYGIVAKYFKTKSNADWKTEDIKAMIEKWEAQLATKDDFVATTFSSVRAFALNAKRDEIYIFLLYITDNGGDKKWDFKLFKGTVGDEEGENTLIAWETVELNGSEAVEKIKQNLKSQKLDMVTVEGSAFVIESEKIVFMVKVTSASDSEYVTAFFQLNEGDKKLEWVYNEKSTDSHSLFFQWENKIYKIPTNDPNDGSEKMMLFDAKKKNFENSSSTITRLQKFLKDKKNFVTATIGSKNKKLLLFIQQKLNGEGKNDAHLWMTDGSRVSYVGTIVTGFKGAFYGSVLYTNDALLALHQKYKTDNDGEEEKNNFCFKRLQGQLSNITKILKAWNEGNEKIKELYKGTATATTSSFTDGLVGLLSGTNGGKTEWQDKYFNLHATILQNGATKMPTGVTFSGKNAGAKWQLKQEGKEQPYNFKEFGFTLVATVGIGSSKIKPDHNSILGVILTGDNKVGLWCTTGGKWGVSVKNDQTQMQTSLVDCKPDETYYVAVILNTSILSVYVNGQQLSKSGDQQIDVTVSSDIEHVYFGAESDKTTDVTITNVLLYNRPFTEDEIKQLKPKQHEADSQAILQDNGSTLTEKNGNTEQYDDSLKTLAEQTATKNEKQEEEESSSPPPTTTEDSAVRVGDVGVLCFMLFGVFTLLGRYVY